MAAIADVDAVAGLEDLAKAEAHCTAATPNTVLAPDSITSIQAIGGNIPFDIASI